MKNTRWQAWETIGLLWTLAAGNLLHFVYQWTGESTVAGLFAVGPVFPGGVYRPAHGRSGRTSGGGTAGRAGGHSDAVLHLQGDRGTGVHDRGYTDFSGVGAAGLLGEPGPAKGQAAGRRRLDGGGAAGAAWDMGGVSAVYLPAAGAGDIYRPGDRDKGDRIRGTFYKVQRFMGRANQPPFFLDRGDGIRYNRGENHPGGRRRHEKNDRA